jgi:L,D-transpeptidase catalytic domain
VIDGGIVVRTLHVSSSKGYETPAGLWTVFRKEQRSWSVPYKVSLPWASYFVGGVAFHEYPDVPVTAASHGCVRVPRYDALAVRLPRDRHARHGRLEVAMRARLLLVTGLVAIVAAAGSAAAVQTQPPANTLTVALSMPTPGFQVGAVRGRDVVVARGLEIDLARAIAARMGIRRVRFVNEPVLLRLTAAGRRSGTLPSPR